MGGSYQSNGTYGRVQTMQCTKDEPTGEKAYAKAVLADLQDQWRAHTSGQVPLSPQASLYLRGEIERFSKIVYGDVPMMSAGYSASESAYLAQRAEEARRQANTLGIWAAGPVFGALPAAGRLLGAPEAAVESLGELNANLAGAFMGGRGKVVEPLATKPGMVQAAPPRPPPGASVSVKPKYVPLDWKAVVPKKGPYKGQNREDHVRLHNTDNPAKPDHGVFYGDGVDVTNRAWQRAQDLGLAPDAGGTLVVPMNDVVGRAGGLAADTGRIFYDVTIKVVPGTNQIITAFPGP